MNYFKNTGAKLTKPQADLIAECMNSQNYVIGWQPFIKMVERLASMGLVKLTARYTGYRVEIVWDRFEVSADYPFGTQYSIKTVV